MIEEVKHKLRLQGHIVLFSIPFKLWPYRESPVLPFRKDLAVALWSRGCGYGASGASFKQSWKTTGSQERQSLCCSDVSILWQDVIWAKQ